MHQTNEKNDLFTLTKWLVAKNLPMQFPIILGFLKDNGAAIEGLTELGNTIIGGETGSGKSTFLHSLICSLIIRFAPEQLKLLLIDTKQMEFSEYKELPHLFRPILNNPVSSISALESLASETDRRLKSGNNLPLLLVIIDTFSDLIYTNKARFIETVKKITESSDKTNIYVVMADSRVSPELFTPELLDMFKTKIAFRTSDGNALRLLMGKDDLINPANPGEMLFFKNGGSGPVEIRCVTVEEGFIQLAIERALS